MSGDFRDQLAEQAWGVLVAAQPDRTDDLNVIAHAIVGNLLPLIEARVQATANQRAAEAEGAFIRATQLAQQWEINAQSTTDPLAAIGALVAAGQLRAALAKPGPTT